VRHVLTNLTAKYFGTPWADRSADGHADSIEGAINLYNREPVTIAAQWIDAQTRRMWDIQKHDGVIEGWHGDGNFARTSLMYALWKTQGTHLEPWRPDLRVGAVRDGDALVLFLAADQPWKGRLVFDKARHKSNMHLPIDYPRINQFPEWFTAADQQPYRVEGPGPARHISGRDLQRGMEVELPPGKSAVVRVTLPTGDGRTGQ
jgi:hypothetical protein